MLAPVITPKASKKEQLLSGLVLVLHCAVIGLALMVLVTPNGMFGTSSGLASLQLNGTAFDAYIASIGSNTTTVANQTQTTSVSSASLPFGSASLASTSTTSSSPTATFTATPASITPSTSTSTANNTSILPRSLALQPGDLNDPPSTPAKLRRRRLPHPVRFNAM